MGRGNWPEFRDGAASANHNDVLPCRHSVEQGGRVLGKFLKADVDHACIISLCSTGRDLPPSDRTSFYSPGSLAGYLTARPRLSNVHAYTTKQWPQSGGQNAGQKGVSW